VESDYDRDAVGCLAKRLVDYSGRPEIVIWTAGKRAYNGVARRLRKNPDALKVAVRAYLENSDGVIFVIDRDSQVALEARRQEPFSMVSQIEKVVASGEFDGKVHLALAVEELEAWLLTDCVGICCYFVQSRYKKNCRERVVDHRNLGRLIKKYQKGDTELIVEAERGGAGAKEHLTKFSEAVLTALNPKARRDTVDRNRYREALAPEIARHVEISRESLRRNRSFQRFCTLLLSVETKND
jgi:phage gp36-like protein